jgi:hypothetical protein
VGWRGSPTRAVAALIALLAAGAAPAGAQSGAIRLRVLSESGESLALPAASLPELGRRVLGDSGGVVVFRDVPPGSWRLVVERVGYRRAALTVAVASGRATDLELRLLAEPITVAPVAVTARAPERERFEDDAQVSTRSLDVRDITAVPALLESDVLRAVQLLPGVVARNDYSVGINVRGGDADQNLVLLDGQVVFNPFHLGGVVSTFADEAVEGVEFLAGGFPARHGGRLSSVLEVDQRTGSLSRVHGSASVSLLSSKLHLEGPLPAGAGSWLVAARRTYADQLVETFSSSSFPYHFQDLVGRITLPSALGGVLSTSLFASGDYFDFELTEANSGQPAQHFRFDWGDRALGLAYRRALGGRATLTQRLGGSSFFADVEVGPGLLRFENRVRRIALAGDLEVRSTDHRLAAGYVAERHDIEYLAGSGDLDLSLASLAYRPRALEAYLEDQWRVTPRLLLRSGARLTHVAGAGFTRVAPRFAAKLFLGEDAAISAAAGRYYQYIHSLRNEEIPITLFEFWIGTDSTVPVSASDHAVLGLERWFGEGLSVSLEGYWKRMKNLVDGDPEEDPGVNGDEFLTARGDAWGFDLYARKTSGRFRGWLSYSFGEVSRTLDETGERYAPAQDRRHTFNAVASFPGPLGAHWTVRFGYGSPLPYTGIAGQWIHRFYDPGRNIFIGAFTEPYRAERNSQRYPAYSRLDLSARWEFRWLGARWHPTASLLNAYARTNVFVYFHDYTRDPPLRRGFSQFPFFPSVGMEVEF